MLYWPDRRGEKALRGNANFSVGALVGGGHSEGMQSFEKGWHYRRREEAIANQSVESLGKKNLISKA